MTDGYLSGVTPPEFNPAFDLAELRGHTTCGVKGTHYLTVPVSRPRGDAAVTGVIS